MCGGDGGGGAREKLTSTVGSLYRGHQWDPVGCPVWRGVWNSEVGLYTTRCCWD